MEPNTTVSSSPVSGMPSAPVSTSTPQISSNRDLTSPMDLLKFGWRLLTNHWKVLVPVFILPSVISYIGSLLGVTHAGILVFVGALISIVGAIFSVAMIPAVIDAIKRVSTDSSTVVTLKEQYRLGFKYFWSIILIGIIFGFAQMGSLVLFVIPGVIVWVYASMYLFTLVIDGKKGFSALTESYSLVHGRWWPVLGRIVLLGIVMMIAWVVLWAIVSGIGAIFGLHLFSFAQSADPATSSSIGMFIFSAIINLIGTCILAPIGMGYTYKLYESLKATRESSVETKTFKNWLVGFICVGVVAVVIMLASIPFMIMKVGYSKNMQIGNDVQNRMVEVQRQIDVANLENIQQGQNNIPVQQ